MKQLKLMLSVLCAIFLVAGTAQAMIVTVRGTTDSQPHHVFITNDGAIHYADMKAIGQYQDLTSLVNGDFGISPLFPPISAQVLAYKDTPSNVIGRSATTNWKGRCLLDDGIAPSNNEIMMVLTNGNAIQISASGYYTYKILIPSLFTAINQVDKIIAIDVYLVRAISNIAIPGPSVPGPIAPKIPIMP